MYAPGAAAISEVRQPLRHPPEQNRVSVREPLWVAVSADVYVPGYPLLGTPARAPLVLTALLRTPINDPPGRWPARHREAL
ncbi:hypothetical protein GCM10010429_38660 [Micromonospora olivasterospora]|uniref:Uncharacterized protein n=1 Tax=Micromonospora olivasterospora TaxID=1880 RepID=A0A562I9N9_MICOL|nr:hypothetical protein JD77_02723 [Micromonospora olivasterospora]